MDISIDFDKVEECESWHKSYFLGDFWRSSRRLLLLWLGTLDASVLLVPTENNHPAVFHRQITYFHRNKQALPKPSALTWAPVTL